MPPGKDGIIKHVMSGLSPQRRQRLRLPRAVARGSSARFLVARKQRVLPERGRIAIFNRSYYEEVLILRVHPENL